MSNKDKQIITSHCGCTICRKGSTKRTEILGARKNDYSEDERVSNRASYAVYASLRGGMCVNKIVFCLF